jgi:hypothetical protein
MHHKQYAVMLLLFGLTLLLTRTPDPLNAQTSRQVAQLQATSVAQPSLATETAFATPVVPEINAPIGANTRQALMIAGVVLALTLLIGGGIYLRQWWLANRW